MLLPGFNDLPRSRRNRCHYHDFTSSIALLPLKTNFLYLYFKSKQIFIRTKFTHSSTVPTGSQVHLQQKQLNWLTALLSYSSYERSECHWWSWWGALNKSLKSLPTCCQCQLISRAGRKEREKEEVHAIIRGQPGDQFCTVIFLLFLINSPLKGVLSCLWTKWSNKPFLFFWHCCWCRRAVPMHWCMFMWVKSSTAIIKIQSY